MYADMDNLTPLIFILQVGADPTAALFKFAETMGMRSQDDDKLGIISLGQGQTQKALNLIDDSAKTGKWVLLQNCHLSMEFMPYLEKEVLKLPDREELHDDFRLFLTSMPASFFSKSVL
jgi:dynein heavy chain